MKTNGPRFAARPLAGGGTAVQDWLAADRPPALKLDECAGLVVVAPHPDDETLGIGATAAQLAASGVPVQLVAVSDGGWRGPGCVGGRTAYFGRRDGATNCAVLQRF
ncbi:PIG-L deacetylase family protein [Mycobacterium kiyosense]|nr:hypothetical protein IWGMT90018_59010 [Mycobacterium kiyosense]